MKVDHYGEMIAKVLNKKLLAYVEFGSYQGDYIAAIEDGENIVLFKGYYGSCSGCDWLEDERDYNTSSVPDERAKAYVDEYANKSFATIPKSTFLSVDVETFTQMLPANTRRDIYEFEPEKLHQAIKENLTATV